MDPKGNRVRTLPPSERLRSVPPLDPTVPPSVARIPVARPSSVSGLRPAARPPVLASECLRDDIAPLEPHAAGGRRTLSVLGAIALVAGVFSATSHVALTPVLGAGIALGGLLLVCAGALSGYAARASFSAIAALVTIGFVIAALARQHAFSAQPALLLLRTVAPVLLASALLMRATYRAHRATRAVLGPSIVLFLLAASFAGGVPVWSPAASLIPRVAAATMGVVGLLSLLGFMSEQTTGGASGWAALALVVGASSLVLDGVHPLVVGWLVPSIALGAAMASLAVAVFQVAAARVGPIERARENVRHSQPPPPPAEEA